MKGWLKLSRVCIWLSIVSALFGFLEKLFGWEFSGMRFPAYPLSFLRFAGYLLLLSIAISLMVKAEKG